MHCLLVAATASEISPFLEFYRKTKNQLRDKLELDIIITGVGLLASTYSITRQIHYKKPAIIIQAGIGGSFKKKIPLGSVVAIKQELIGDQGVTEAGKWTTLYGLGLIKGDKFPFTKGWLINNSAILKKIQLKKVKGITTNEITTAQKKIQFYTDTFDPTIESLEGAALHYICLMEKIKFLQIRSISNYIGDRDKNNWQINKSITNLNKELIKILKSI